MYKKIDLYVPKNGQWVYVCSTTQSKTCKNAIVKYTQENSIIIEHQNVKALFSRG